jgi:O-acetyl-ADP-ribose deacetylase (regulator of RNase III)
MGTEDEVAIGKTKVRVIQGDITLQETDAIVNAANSGLMGGGGVDGAIHHAGGPAILNECREIISHIGRLDTGQAVITSGGNLAAKFVIHTVGPIWHGGDRGEPELLASAYRESLKVAAEHELISISFPSISTGVYRYPVRDAAKIALETIASFIQRYSTTIEEIIIVLYDSSTYSAYSEAIGLYLGK